MIRLTGGRDGHPGRGEFASGPVETRSLEPVPRRCRPAVHGGCPDVPRRLHHGAQNGEKECWLWLSQALRAFYSNSKRGFNMRLSEELIGTAITECNHEEETRSPISLTWRSLEVLQRAI